MSYSQIALRYAEDVTAGIIPASKWVRLACARHLQDLERADATKAAQVLQPAFGGFAYEYRPAMAERACAFIELLPHIKGEWARRGEHIKLQPWQVFIICCVFGWYRPDGLRRFRTVYIEVARKNAKSTLSAGVGLYMLTLDGEPGAEVYSAATTREQARIVFQTAQAMARREADFRAAYGVEVGAHNIHVFQTASKFEALSADANSLDGLNVHCGLIDELHAHRSRDVWDVIETATGSRTQPLVWTITTAGSNRAGICYEQRTYVTKVLQGLVQDETYWGIIYTLDEGDEFSDPAVWIKPNPNLGVSVYRDDLERKVRKALTMPSAQNNVLTKHFNVWVSADVAWMDMRAWDACSDSSLSIDQFAGQPCIVGLDLASKTDIAAMVLLFKRNGEYYVFGKYYLPEETVEDSANSQYSGWVRSGRLTTTPGNVIDFDYIEQDLRELKSKHQITCIPYDPFQATQLAVRLANDGYPMVELGQTVKNLSEPMKHTEALVLTRKLHHDGCPVMAWMMSNVVAHTDVKENIYPRKEQPQNKIDGPVALFMCMNRELAMSAPKPTVAAWVLGKRQ